MPKAAKAAAKAAVTAVAMAAGTTVATAAGTTVVMMPETMVAMMPVATTVGVPEPVEVPEPELVVRLEQEPPEPGLLLGPPERVLLVQELVARVLARVPELAQGLVVPELALVARVLELVRAYNLIWFRPNFICQTS